jgi:hypothetical protein
MARGNPMNGMAGRGIDSSQEDNFDAFLSVSIGPRSSYPFKDVKGNK